MDYTKFRPPSRKSPCGCKICTIARFKQENLEEAERPDVPRIPEEEKEEEGEEAKEKARCLFKTNLKPVPLIINDMPFRESTYCFMSVTHFTL